MQVRRSLSSKIPTQLIDGLNAIDLEACEGVTAECFFFERTFGRKCFRSAMVSVALFDSSL